MAKTYSRDDVKQIFVEMIKASTQRAVAKQLGFSVPFVNDVFHGKRELSDNLAEAMGFIKESFYRKVA